VGRITLSLLPVLNFQPAGLSTYLAVGCAVMELTVTSILTLLLLVGSYIVLYQFF
jgi:hypothetical protein